MYIRLWKDEEAKKERELSTQKTDREETANEEERKSGRAKARNESKPRVKVDRGKEEEKENQRD